MQAKDGGNRDSHMIRVVYPFLSQETMLMVTKTQSGTLYAGMAPIMTPQNHERLVDAFGTHWIKYAMPVFVLVVLLMTSTLLFYFSGLSAHHLMWLSHATLLLALVLLVTVHHWFFHRVLSDGMDDVIITDKRVIFLSFRTPIAK